MDRSATAACRCNRRNTSETRHSSASRNSGAAQDVNSCRNSTNACARRSARVRRRLKNGVIAAGSPCGAFGPAMNAWTSVHRAPTAAGADDCKPRAPRGADCVGCMLKENPNAEQCPRPDGCRRNDGVELPDSDPDDSTRPNASACCSEVDGGTAASSTTGLRNPAPDALPTFRNRGGMADFPPGDAVRIGACGGKPGDCARPRGGPPAAAAAAAAGAAGAGAAGAGATSSATGSAHGPNEDGCTAGSNDDRNWALSKNRSDTAS